MKLMTSKEIRQQFLDFFSSNLIYYHIDPKIEYRHNRKLPQIFSDGSKFTLKPEAKTEGNPTSETLLEHFFKFSIDFRLKQDLRSCPCGGLCQVGWM